MESIIRNDDDDNGDCGCHFDEARITPMPEHGSRDPCFDSCMGQFMETVLSAGSTTGGADGTSAGSGSVTAPMCKRLKSDKRTEQFWPLYWCDMKYCGIQINQTSGQLGQDPRVNGIINSCNNLGISPVLDSGPPPVGFSCHSGYDVEPICTGQASLSKASPTGRDQLASSHRPTSRPTTSSNAVDAHGSSHPAKNTTSGSDLSAGAKIAVAVCSVFGLLTIVCMIFLCLRRRKRRKAQFHNALHSRRGGDGFPCSGGGYSPTPLISPAGSAIGSTTEPPLTPPLRLRDRRILLPSILRPGNRSPSPPLTPLTPAYSPSNSHHGSAAFFPPSPICAPTTNKLVPRHERTPTPQKIPTLTTTADITTDTAPSIVTSRASATTTQYCPTTLTGHSHSSLRHELSLLSSPALHSSPTPTSSHPPPPSAPPGSPTRPPRPHEAPLEIPDLLTAAKSPSPPLPVPVPVPPLPAFGFPQGQQQRSYSSPWRSGAGTGAGTGAGAGTGPVVVGRKSGGQALKFVDFSGLRSATADSGAGTGGGDGGRREGRINHNREEARGSWGSWDGTTNAAATAVGTGAGRDGEPVVADRASVSSNYGDDDGGYVCGGGSGWDGNGSVPDTGTIGAARSASTPIAMSSVAGGGVTVPDAVVTRQTGGEEEGDGHERGHAPDDPRYFIGGAF